MSLQRLYMTSPPDWDAESGLLKNLKTEHAFAVPNLRGRRSGAASWTRAGSTFRLTIVCGNRTLCQVMPSGLGSYSGYRQGVRPARSGGHPSREIRLQRTVSRIIPAVEIL